MKTTLKTFIALAALAGFSSAAMGQGNFSIVWNTDGISGAFEGTLAPTVSGDGASFITGVGLSRGSDINSASLTNGFSSNGWDSTEGGEYFEFGFTVQSGFFVDLSESFLGLRSSNTGPGNMELLVSTDNFDNSTSEATFALPGGSGASAWLNQTDDLSSLTNLTGTVLMRISKTNEISANGGSIGSGGTFALGQINQGSGLEASGLSGTVTAIPEPST